MINRFCDKGTNSSMGKITVFSTNYTGTIGYLFTNEKE